ncbi:MAG: hypothetical protein ACLTTP_10295 [Alistipes ihumii]
MSRESPASERRALPKAITDFSRFVRAGHGRRSAGTTTSHDRWPWVDHYPQSVGWSESPDRAECVPVAVAEHPLSNIGHASMTACSPKPTVTT